MKDPMRRCCSMDRTHNGKRCRTHMRPLGGHGFFRFEDGVAEDAGLFRPVGLGGLLGFGEQAGHLGTTDLRYIILIFQ